MKNIENSNKSSFLKKIFIKICRKLGYEIIDQNNFKIVTSNKKINGKISYIKNGKFINYSNLDNLLNIIEKDIS